MYNSTTLRVFTYRCSISDPVASFVNYASKTMPQYQFHVFRSEEDLFANVKENKCLVFTCNGKQGYYVFYAAPLCVTIGPKGTLRAWKTDAPDDVCSISLEKPTYEESRNLRDNHGYFISRGSDGNFYEHKDNTEKLLLNGASDISRIAEYPSVERTISLTSIATTIDVSSLLCPHQDKFSNFLKLNRIDYTLRISSVGTEDKFVYFSVFKSCAVPGCILCSADASRNKQLLDVLPLHNTVCEGVSFTKDKNKTRIRRFNLPRNKHLVKGDCFGRSVTMELIPKLDVSRVDLELKCSLSSGHLLNVCGSGLLKDRNHFYVVNEDSVCTLLDYMKSPSLLDSKKSPKLSVVDMNKGFVRNMVNGMLSLHKVRRCHGNLQASTVKICEHNVNSTRILSANLSDAKGTGSFGKDFVDLGHIIFYYLTGGEFLDDRDRDKDHYPYNTTAKRELSKNYPEVHDLIFTLLLKSPTDAQVSEHAIFFDSSKAASFFMDTSQILQTVFFKNKHNLLCIEMEAIFGNVFSNKSNWAWKLNTGVFNTYEYYKDYNTSSMRSLLLAIRNGMGHRLGNRPEIQAVLGKSESDIGDYYRKECPQLFMEVYKVMRKYCKDKPFMDLYFHQYRNLVQLARKNPP